MHLRNDNASFLQLFQQSIEAPDLLFCVSDILCFQTVGRTEMGIDPADLEIFHGKYLSDLLHSLLAEAQPVHSRVYLHMHLYGLPLPV